MFHRTTKPLSVGLLLALGAAALVAPAITRAFAPQSTAGTKRVPIGYAPRPEWVKLQMSSPRTDGEGFATRVTNIDTRTITELQFVAIVEHVGGTTPVRVLTSPAWTVNLNASQSQDLSARWLTSDELDHLVADAAPLRVQMFLTPSHLKFADGSEWQLPIDPTARDHRAAMKLGIPDIPRSLLAAAAPQTGRTVCRDDQNRPYSAGAMVPIRNEPGAGARCIDGRWVETNMQGVPLPAR